MKSPNSRLWLIVWLLLLLSPGTTSRAEPVGTSFTYQGWIVDANRPANGLYDFQFKLFDANTAGQQIANTIEVNDVNVVDGHFGVELDFCRSQGQQGRVSLDVFGGDARWLEIGIRRALGDQGPVGHGPASEFYAVLSPRRKITATPYALHALSGGGLYDVLRWPSNWNLGLGEASKPPGDAGGQSLFNVGKLGIGTTSPAYPLDVAGALNLNKDKTGIALTVNGKEALWSNDTYFSWGYGGAANFFGDNVGIGPYATEPAERLDLSWSGGVNARVGRYNYLGSCFSSATLVLGNNVRARTDNVNGIVVGQPHDSYGYRAITMSLDGIKFYGRTGTVKADDPLDAATERMRITNEGRVGIGTTHPLRSLSIQSGDFEQIELKGTDPLRSAGVLLYNNDNSVYAQIGLGGTQFPNPALNGCRNSLYLSVMGVNADIVFESSLGNAQYIMKANGNFGIGTLVPTEKLDVGGTARLRQMAPGSGTLVVADSAGKLWKQSSSRRYKTNVRNLDDDPEKVLDLRPVQFRWATTSQQDIGLIAEEVAESMKELVVYDAEGKPDAVKYDKVSLYLLKVVKDLKSENESLKQRLDLVERRMEKLEREDSHVAREVRQSDG